MTITIHLPPATEQKLHAQAAATGKDVETLVREAVEVTLALSDHSFRELLEPLHREVEESGIPEGELAALVDGEVAAARTERMASRKQQSRALTFHDP